MHSFSKMPILRNGGKPCSDRYSKIMKETAKNERAFWYMDI